MFLFATTPCRFELQFWVPDATCFLAGNFFTGNQSAAAQFRSVVEELEKEVRQLQKRKPGGRGQNISVQPGARGDDFPWYGDWFSCGTCLSVFVIGGDPESDVGEARCPDCGHKFIRS
jgi:DNA-directed RNA polymerase subunit RPC12/RpoP